MKNKHTLANKKLKQEVDKNLDAATWNLYKSKINKDFYDHDSTFRKTSVTSKVYTKWWQKLLNWITFGLYKPTTFWYKIKPVKK